MSWLPACPYFTGLRFSFSTVPKDYIISIVGPYNTRTHFTGEPLLSVVLAINNDKRLKEDLLVLYGICREILHLTGQVFLGWIGASSLSMYFVLPVFLI